MTTVMGRLVAQARKTHRAHGIVMTVVMTIALVAASAVLEPAPSAALPPTPQEFVAIPEPAAGCAVPQQSLGYLELDWSAASGGAPGLGHPSVTGDFSAGVH